MSIPISIDLETNYKRSFNGVNGGARQVFVGLVPRQRIDGPRWADCASAVG